MDITINVKVGTTIESVALPNAVGVGVTSTTPPFLLVTGPVIEGFQSVKLFNLNNVIYYQIKEEEGKDESIGNLSPSGK